MRLYIYTCTPVKTGVSAAQKWVCDVTAGLMEKSYEYNFPAVCSAHYARDTLWMLDHGNLTSFCQCA